MNRDLGRCAFSTRIYTIPSEKNMSQTDVWGTRRVLYMTDSLGYRDASIRDVAPISQSAKRILILGDSFAEGSGVNYEDTFSAQLQKILKDRGRDVETLDAGVSSYCPTWN